MNLLLKFQLFFVINTSKSREFALNFAFTILHIELLLGLGLIHILLQFEDLLVVLVGLLGILILSTLEFIIFLLDVTVKFLFLMAELVEFTLSLQARLDILAELPEGELTEFGIEHLELLNQVVFVLLDLLLIPIDIRIVLKLSA